MTKPHISTDDLQAWVEEREAMLHRALNDGRHGDEAEALPRVVATAPGHIYLVIGEDCPPDAAFRECEEVHWCEDRIDANSIPYMRVDLARWAGVAAQRETETPVTVFPKQRDERDAALLACKAACERIVQQYGGVQCGVDFRALLSAVDRVLAGARPQSHLGGDA